MNTQARASGVTLDATLPADSLAQAVESADLEARSIGRFAVLRKLGEGGMGIVYAAFDERLARRVAIKLLRSADHARLMREAQALARLSHPHVTQVYEVGEALGRVFVAMEYVDGPTLAQWLQAERRDAAAILGVFLQAGEGLAAAHASGLVHRDFKPGNVLVGDDGRVRVLDFGLARAGDSIVDGAGPGHAPATLSSLTQTGMLLGTPAYMSPEQHAALPVDARSDQFGFCAALFEALYGERPFAGDTLPELAHNLMLGNLRTPRPRGDVPPDVYAAIVRGLAPAPEQRWPSMRALLAVIGAGYRRSMVVGDSGISRWVGIGAGVVGVAALAAVSLLWERPEAVTAADNVRLAVCSLIAGLAAAPWLLRRFPRQRGRQMVGVAIVFLGASLATRVAFWAVGGTLLEEMVAETVVFMTINATLAVALRIPWLLINLVVLAGALVAVLGLGSSPYLFAAAWILSVSIGSIAWRRLWVVE